MSPVYSGVTILFSVIMSMLSLLLEHLYLLKSGSYLLEVSYSGARVETIFVQPLFYPSHE